MLAHIIVFGSVCVLCFGLEYGTLLVMMFYDDEFVVGGFELTLDWLVAVSSVPGGGERSAF